LSTFKNRNVYMSLRFSFLINPFHFLERMF